MANVSSSNSLGERVPKLRFPEFEGGWDSELFLDLFTFLSNNTLSRFCRPQLRINKTFRTVLNGCSVNTIYMFFIEKTQFRFYKSVF